MCPRRALVFATASAILGVVSGAGHAFPEPNPVADPQWPVKVIRCFEDDRVLSCFRRLLEDKVAEEGVTKVSTGRSAKPASSDLVIKNVTSLLSLWEKSLATHLQQEVKEIFKKPLGFSALSNFFSGNSSARGMKNKMNMKNMMPYMIVPGLFLAGIMPWVMPPLMKMVMVVGMMNQVAFSSALFSLIRGYIFDTNKDEHVFYINHGYKNEKFHQEHPNHASRRKDAKWKKRR